MLRFISVLQRKRRFITEGKQSLAVFYQKKNSIATLPAYQETEKTLLIIRLDDIGDYLLFRNTLPAYKQSPRWKDYTITLLGNIVWKELFELLDKDTTDKAIWVNKKEYFQQEHYQYNLWLQLRKEGYTVVICPSATRPVLLDDLCRLAAGSETAIAFSNFTPHKQWKEVSDKLYTALYEPGTVIHECILNHQFANWSCSVLFPLQPPFIRVQKKMTANPYLVLFIGASTRSKRWPAKRWLQLIYLLKKDYPFTIKVMGVGSDKKTAVNIANQTSAEAVTNTRLTDVIEIIANAKAVITNDTMTAHLGASMRVPVIIIANGGNVFLRFTNYEKTSINNIITIFPDLFNNLRKRNADDDLQNHIAATSDIASIKADTVFKALKKLI